MAELFFLKENLDSAHQNIEIATSIDPIQTEFKKLEEKIKISIHDQNNFELSL